MMFMEVSTQKKIPSKDQPKIDRKRDARRARTLLCLPIYNRAGLRVGAIQLLNKKDGVFSIEDEAILKTFGNHASVFIEIAQLQKARIDALEESRKELEQLKRAKNKALDHLAHELRTPLAVVQGNMRLLRWRLQKKSPPVTGDKWGEHLLCILSDVWEEVS